MAVRKRRPNRTYGIDNALQEIAPRSINSQRAPTTSDLAEIGQQWVDIPNDAVYVLTSITADSANWATSPASGSETLSQLTVTGTTNLQGAVTLDSTLAVTGATTLADANITGTMTFTGDVDLTSSAVIDITSTLNADPAIRIVENGGVNGTIRIRADQGTRTDSVELLSDVGGISLIATGYALDDAISILANSGGVDIDAALQINIASSENAADAIVINASAGGIDITNTGTAGEDIDITSTGASVNITATEDVAQAIYLHANGGTSESIRIHSDQGTAVDSIAIDSDAGGVGITAGTDITLAPTNDISILAGDSISLSASENAVAAINIAANGGVLETIAINCIQGTAANSIDIESDAGGITLTSNLASDDGINLNAVGGGVDIDGALQVNITSTEAAADAIVINASNAAGGIDLLTGGGDIDITSAGGINIISTENAASAITIEADGGISETVFIHSDQGTSATSINIQSDVGGITLDATGLASADAINLSAGAGGVDIDGALQVNIASSQDATDAIVLSASAGGINISATGEAGQDIDIINTGGSVSIISTENDSNAVFIEADGGISERITLHSDQGTSASSIFLLSDVGGITLQSVGNATADAINLDAVAGGIDIDAALQISIESSQVAADAIKIDSLGGGIDVDAVLQIAISSTQDASDAILIDSGAGGIDILATGEAGQDIDITNTGGSVNITATEAAADAIVINASNAAGGIDLLTGGGEVSISSSGNVSMAPSTATAASPTATVVINARVFKATFTGFTTGAAASQAFTITNSALGAGDGVMLTVANRGSNDAQMTLNRVNTQTAGTIIVNTTNNGAAALNGDVIITGWIID